ncbi:MAG: hypothetical protein K0S65_3334 [Labilithrix sp.]|nr:hypothetical protein [Labilithrix sp.]
MAELPSRLRRRSGAFAIALGLLFLLFSAEAKAQLHWDASAQVGVMKRFLASRPSGSDDAGFGPTGQVMGHVALLPLLHVGGYFGMDVSPLPGDAAAKNTTFGGLRLKGRLPWIRGRVRTWIFAGFGYAGAYAPSFATTFTITDGSGVSERRRVKVEGGGGTFFEVPFGIGASYKFFEPWELCAELGARAGFGHSGTIYDPPGPGVTAPDLPSQRASPAGLDRFALGLTVGVMIDL